MDYIFYEQSGKLLAAQIMEQKEHHFHAKGLGSSLQKIKSKDVLLKGNVPQSNAIEIAAQIETLLNDVDLGLVWECAPDEAFDFTFLAREYFGESVSLIEQATMWQSLYSAPIYFAKKGKGQFLKQPFEQIQLALAAIAKKEERLKQQGLWVDALLKGNCPTEILSVRDTILRKQNVNDMAYKAVQQASEQAGLSISQLLLHAGAFQNAFDLHRSVFLAEYYPKGVAAHLSLPHLNLEDIPFNDAVEAFSIDDSLTVEIDDAFSVMALGDQKYRIGVHIAAPSLAVNRDDEADRHAASRMSTMYIPGEKITMLPDDWVAYFSLNEGSSKSVVSIYVTLSRVSDQADWVLSQIESKIERIKIIANLRHDVSEMQLSAQDLEGDRMDYPQADALKILWQGAQHLSGMRDTVRGRPENNNRADFSFVVKTNNAVLTGDEPVEITQRQRGSPIDKIVSEWMIFANVNWAIMLSELNVPALFRTQSNLGARTSTHAQAHLAMGVPAYMWSTSPLRRYADWFNQMQLLAAIKHGVTAPIHAPFKAREVDVLTRMSSFDEKYKAYNEQQNKMERFWCLKWVMQHMSHENLFEAQAIVIREGVLRLKEIPLYLPCAGLPADIPLQTEVRVRLSNIDLVDLKADISLIHSFATESTEQ